MLVGSLLVLIGLLVVLRGHELENYALFETFDSGDTFELGLWKKSQQPKYQNQAILVKPPTNLIPGYETDLGVQLTQEMKHYGFGTLLKESFSPSGQNIIFQYELKLEEPVACGGAYVKLLRANKNLSIESFDNNTPYSIMFGPDKCGGDSKVHFIVQFQNPVTKEWSEHHLKTEQRPRMDKTYHLYTFAINNDSSFSLFVDGKPTFSGSLLKDLDPPINPEAEIDDPTDFKPSSWVDDEFMDDTTAKKPDNWDESQPRRVRDTKSVKPSKWDENLPIKVPDPTARKPDDWDDEEDGEWEAPLVENPQCEALPGCGPWEPPLIDNPLYKGKWKVPKVANPAYKGKISHFDDSSLGLPLFYCTIGQWRARKIINKNYFHVANPYEHLAPIGAVAVEVWTTTAGILFDNFLLTNDSATAHAVGRDYFAPKHKKEKESIKNQAREATQAARAEIFENGDSKEKIAAVAEIAKEYMEENPWVVINSLFALVMAMSYYLIYHTQWTVPGSEKESGKKKSDKKEAPGIEN